MAVTAVAVTDLDRTKRLDVDHLALGLPEQLAG